MAHLPRVGYRPRPDPSVAVEAIKAAKRRAHPDAGGTDDAFHKVSEAADVMTREHGL